jgi:hypothetical protein
VAKGCACWAAIARQIARPGLLSLRLQLRPFQRQSDPVGACLDGANRSIQFCRDHFGAGVCFRHSSKEVILLWRPPVAAEFNHVTTISPSPSARALHLQCDFGQFVSDFSCLFFGQPNNRTAISPQSCGCSGLSVPNHPALASHSYKIACQDCRAGHRSDVDSFAVEYIADHDRPSSREAPRSKGCACWPAIARQIARSRYFPFAFSPSSTRRRMASERLTP